MPRKKEAGQKTQKHPPSERSERRWIQTLGVDWVCVFVCVCVGGEGGLQD